MINLIYWPGNNNQLENVIKHSDKYVGATTPEKKTEATTEFDISEQDAAKINEWLTQHNPECKYYDDGTLPSNPMGAIGGRLTYAFTPTGLGTMFALRCACGAALDLTDTSGW